MVLYDVFEGFWKNVFLLSSLYYEEEVKVVRLFFELVECFCNNSKHLSYSFYFFDQSNLGFETNDLSDSHWF